MDYRELTIEDIEQLNKEIDHYYRMRKLFLGIGWSSIGLSFLFIFVGVFSKASVGISVTISAVLFCGGILFFILRSALYNARISNRKELIAKSTQYQRDKQLFENNKQ